MYSPEVSLSFTIDVEWQGFKFKLVLVYLDTCDGKKNLKMKSKLVNIVGAVDEDTDLILLGDFNAYVGIIGPQELNRNGRRLLDLIETHSLILLNNDEKCVWEITHTEGREVPRLCIGEQEGLQ